MKLASYLEGVDTVYGVVSSTETMPESLPSMRNFAPNSPAFDRSWKALALANCMNGSPAEHRIGRSMKSPIGHPFTMPRR